MSDPVPEAEAVASEADGVAATKWRTVEPIWHHDTGYTPAGEIVEGTAEQMGVLAAQGKVEPVEEGAE